MFTSMLAISFNPVVTYALTFLRTKHTYVCNMSQEHYIDRRDCNRHKGGTVNKFYTSSMMQVLICVLVKNIHNVYN